MILRAVLVSSTFLVSAVFAFSTTIDASEVLPHLRDSGESALNITRACAEVWRQCLPSAGQGLARAAVSLATKGELPRAPEEQRHVKLSDHELEKYTQETLVRRNLIQQRQ